MRSKGDSSKQLLSAFLCSLSWLMKEDLGSNSDSFDFLNMVL